MTEVQVYMIVYSTEDEKVTIEFLEDTKATSLINILNKIREDYFSGTTKIEETDDPVFQAAIEEFHKGFKSKGIGWLRNMSMTKDIRRWSDKSMKAGFRTRRDLLR